MKAEAVVISSPIQDLTEQEIIEATNKEVEFGLSTKDYGIQYTKEEIKVAMEELRSGVIAEERKKEVSDEIAELKKTAEFDLDLALDTYDPTFPGYIPSGEAFEFFSTMRLIAGEDFEFSTPIAHYFMADLLLGYITDKNQFPYSKEVCDTLELDELRIGIMASRGMAKSTVVISFFSVYSAIKGKLNNGIGRVYFYLLIAASSKGGARVNALAVRAMCEDSVYLKEYFEEMRFTETETEFVRRCPSGKTGADAKVPRKNRSFLIRYQGYSTGIRGSRYGERRPDLLCFDDAILNTAAAYSKVISETLDEVIHADAVNALKGGGKGRVVLCFTPFHYGDVNTKALIQGAFTQCVIPMARAFDVDDEDLLAMDILSSWEAMHPSTSIIKLICGARKAKKLQLFMQERMLRLTSGADRLVPDECFQYCDMQDIEKNIANYNIYITTDYTTTSGEKSDFSGRATWAVNNNQDWFLLDVSLRKLGIQAQYRDTLQSAAKYKNLGRSVYIGVEIDGNQQAHLDGLQVMMRSNGDYYSFARQKNAPEGRIGILSRAGSTGGKHERFRIAVPRFLNKKIWLPEHLKNSPDLKEMVLQIKGATHTAFSRSDDGPDLVSQLDMIDVRYPTANWVNTPKKVHDGFGRYTEVEEPSAYDSY